MKKKVLPLLLTMAMTVGMLSGCGSEADKAPASTDAGADTAQVSNQETGSQEAEPQDEGDYYVDEDGNKYKKFDDVKLKMLMCWNGGFKTASDQYNNEVAEAIREKIGVTVEFEEIMMSEAEKLNMMFASGDMPDMVNAPYWGGTSGETAIIKKAGIEGRLIDVKDLVPQYPNIADAYDVGVVSRKYLENDIDYSENNGARYVLPTQLSGDQADIQVWGYGVFVRQDVAETLGVDPSTIKTADQLFDFMVQARDYGFKDANGNDCIVATTFHNGEHYENYAENFDTKKLTSYVKDEDGNVVYDRLTTNWLDKQMFIWKMVHENILDKECFTQSREHANEKVGNGTALFTCYQYSASINATKQTGLYYSNPEMRYVPVGPMVYSDGSALVQAEAEGRSGSPVIFFPNTCANVEAALTWLDYVNSKEGMRLVCYGFEGETYELNENGQPRMNAELTERYASDPDGVKEELREKGINYMQNTSYVARKNMSWFGELAPFDADAEDKNLTEYKKARPAEVIPGYAIDALAPGFEGYQDFAEWAFDSTKEKEYKERAYFADSEEEARKILEDYQNYLRTNDKGKMQEFLDYMTDQANSRDDLAF